MLRRQAVEIVFRDAVARKLQRLDGERLRRRRPFAGNGALGHPALLDREDRVTGEPVVDVEHPGFRVLDDRGNAAATANDVDQRRLRGEVVIPDVVMNSLLVPAQRSRVRVDRDDTVGVQIAAGALRTRVIKARLRDRREDKSVGDIDREKRPDVRSAGPLPRVVFPCVVPGLARLRHQVERPDERPGSRVPGPHRRLSAAGEHQVLIDGRRRTPARRHFHGAGFAERVDRRPQLDIERQQLRANRREDARPDLAVTGPVGHTAPRGPARRVLPQLPARVTFNRPDAARRREVDDVVDDERRTGEETARVARVNRPGACQSADVGCVDLIERRKLAAARVLTVADPVALCSRRRRAEHECDGECFSVVAQPFRAAVSQG